MLEPCLLHVFTWPGRGERRDGVICASATPWVLSVRSLFVCLHCAVPQPEAPDEGQGGCGGMELERILNTLALAACLGEPESWQG